MRTTGMSLLLRRGTVRCYSVVGRVLRMSARMRGVPTVVPAAMMRWGRVPATVVRVVRRNRPR